MSVCESVSLCLSANIVETWIRVRDWGVGCSSSDTRMFVCLAGDLAPWWCGGAQCAEAWQAIGRHC